MIYYLVFKKNIHCLYSINYLSVILPSEKSKTTQDIVYHRLEI